MKTTLSTHEKIARQVFIKAAAELLNKPGIDDRSEEIDRPLAILAWAAIEAADQFMKAYQESLDLQ